MKQIVYRILHLGARPPGRGMTELERQSWEQDRKHGRDSYILKSMWRNNLGFAIKVSILLILLQWSHFDLREILIGIWIITLAGGWGEGAAIWYRNEKAYKQEGN